MNEYTVFGFYTDTGLRYSSQRTADSPEEAIRDVALTYPDESISICAVVLGYHDDQMDGDYLDDTKDQLQ